MELELFSILFNILELNKFSKCDLGLSYFCIELNNINLSLPLAAVFPTAISSFPYRYQQFSLQQVASLLTASSGRAEHYSQGSLSPEIFPLKYVPSQGPHICRSDRSPPTGRQRSHSYLATQASAERAELGVYWPTGPDKNSLY